MILWLYISTGIFLGWSLGANHAVNVFGTAVISRMVRFRTAALVGGIFVVLGAVISGAGASRTLNQLGAINAIAGCFTVALAVGITVTWMTKIKLPVSTSQAVVGGIVGWNLFTGSPTDMGSLTKILSTWVTSPLIAAAFAFILFKFTVWLIRKTRPHILRLDAYTRTGLIIAGAMASYTLAANNIANVMGMFVPAQPFSDLAVTDWLTITGTQQLFFIGGVAIGVGIYTYGYRVMETVGQDLYKITPITGLIVVVAESLVLFIFASEGLEKLLIDLGLPPLPLVPLSSTQCVIGAVIGVGLARGGGRGINYRILGKIAYGWVITPLIAGLMTLLLLFVMQNVFERKVVHLRSYEITPPVREALLRKGLPAEPLKEMENQHFTGSASFRLALMHHYSWKEKELFDIFEYAEIDTMVIDSSLLNTDWEQADIPSRYVIELKNQHGRMFIHRWQFYEMLESLGEEWRYREGSENRLYNKQVDARRQAVYQLFRKNTTKDF